MQTITGNNYIGNCKNNLDKGLHLIEDIMLSLYSLRKLKFRAIKIKDVRIKLVSHPLITFSSKKVWDIEIDESDNPIEDVSNRLEAFFNNAFKQRRN